MASEEPSFLASLWKQSYSIQIRHIHDFVKQSYLSSMCILQVCQMLFNTMDNVIMNTFLVNEIN